MQIALGLQHRVEGGDIMAVLLVTIHVVTVVVAVAQVIQLVLYCQIFRILIQEMVMRP